MKTNFPQDISSKKFFGRCRQTFAPQCMLELLELLYDYRRYNITPKNGEMLLFLNKAIPIIKKY